MDSLRLCIGPSPLYTIMPRKQQGKALGSIRGRGDYSVATKNIKDPFQRMESKIDHLENKLVKDIMSKSSAAATIGRTLGNFAGQGDLGALAGSSLAKYFGHGDYSVKGNSLMKSGVSGATFSQDGRRGTRITEREFIGDIVSGPLSGASTAFTAQNFTLNPTDHESFPWLSRMSNLYDQWEPNGIVFEFVSTSSEYNGSSQALGAVIIATDYDGYDPVYSTKQEMENADYACSAKPSDGLLHGIECDPSERPTKVLYTSTSNGAPVTLTTLGTTQVATQGCSAAGVTLGELWVSYDITFYKKQMHLSAQNGPLMNFTGTLGVGGPYFNSPTVMRDLSIVQNIGSGSTIHFHNALVGAKYQLVYYLVAGTTQDEGELFGATLAGCTVVYRMADDTATTDLLFVGTYTTTTPNATVTFGLNAAVAHAFCASWTQVPDDWLC